MSKYTKGNTWFDPSAVSTHVDYGSVTRFLEYMRPARGRLALAAVISLVFAGSAYLIPQVFALVESALRGRDGTALLIGLGGYLGVMFVQHISRYAVSRIQAGVYTELSEITLLEYYKKILNLRVPDFVLMRQTSNLFQRVIDVMNTTNQFTATVVYGLLNTVSVVVFGVVVASIAWEILVVLVLGGVAMTAYVLISTPRLRQLHAKVLGTNFPLVSKMLEIIDGMLTIKALTASVGVTRDVQSLVERRRRSQYDEVVYESRIQMMLSLIQTATIVAALGVGFWLFIAGRIELSGLFAAYVLMSAFLSPVQGLAQQYRSLSKLSANLKNFYEVIDRPAEAAPALAAIGAGDGAPPAPPSLNGDAPRVLAPSAAPATDEAPGAIRFEDVAFAYQPGRPVLRGVSFDVPAGQRVALIGRSGAGKTTIFRLLLGFIQPEAGRVIVGGREVGTEADLDAYRKRFGIVSQSDFLFNISIRENLRIGLEDGPDHALESALKAVNMWDHVQSLDQGLDTTYSNDRVSGGQRQRLLIARALARRPDIVLLDEPTSSLDFENEREVMRSLDTLLAGKTSLVIAHRLSTVQRADRVLVLNKGEIVGDGTHKELYDQNEYYRALCDFNSVIV